MEQWNATMERSAMDRSELLDRLRRELSNRDWQGLRPDERLTELDAELTERVERLEQIAASFFDDSDRDIFRALDDLSAALSYFRSDLGRLFTDATRLNNELRAELRRLEADEGPRETTIELPGLSQAAKESRVEVDGEDGASTDVKAEDEQLTLI